MEQYLYLDDDEIIRIVETYSDMLLRIAVNRVKSREEAEDVMQNVYMRLMRARPRFRDEGHERAWLIRTAINLCLDHQRSAAKRRHAPLNEGMAADIPPAAVEVLDAVRRLPERDRYAVYLYYYERMPAREIAKLLGEAEGTVTSRLSRARKKLKTMLKGDGDGTVSNRL